MRVYKAISAVQAELAVEGIAKDRNNAQQGYKFRGIDDCYNALAPIMAKHGLCILPRVLSRECIERQTRGGQPLFYVTVEVEFDFVCAEDGSRHVVKTYGEAMDSADKATNKAMSAAFKYAVLQAFAIPTEGDNDADATTHEVAPKAQPKAKPLPKAPEAVQAPPEPPEDPSKVSRAQVKMIWAKMKAANVTAEAIFALYGITGLSQLDKAEVDKLVKWLDGKGPAPDAVEEVPPPPAPPEVPYGEHADDVPF